MKVRIYKPSASAMQSGTARTNKWVLEMEPQSKRSPEPLMGWAQSKDTLAQIRLTFDTKEAAIEHAKMQDWDYTVAVSREKKVKPRSYMDNFKYFPAEEEGA